MSKFMNQLGEFYKDEEQYESESKNIEEICNLVP